MSKFAELTETYITFIRNKLGALEALFLPLAHTALKAGVADLAAIARQSAGAVMADPALLTDDARRKAAVDLLAARLAQDSVTIGENELHAFAAAALAQCAPAKPEEGATPAPEAPEDGLAEGAAGLAKDETAIDTGR